MTERFILCKVRAVHRHTLTDTFCFLLWRLPIAGIILSKHPFLSCAFSATEPLLLRAHSNVSNLTIQASVHILFFLEPHCSSDRLSFSSDADCICTAKKNFSAVLKSASNNPIILSMCTFLFPFFFSNITSISFAHLLLTNPYRNGRLIMMHKNSAQ